MSCFARTFFPRDIAIYFQDTDAATTESFEWLSQLRFDFNPTSKDPTEGLTVRMADAQFQYGFEYLGIGERLVQTPLTDRYAAKTLERTGGQPSTFRINGHLSFSRNDVRRVAIQQR